MESAILSLVTSGSPSFGVDLTVQPQQAASQPLLQLSITADGFDTVINFARQYRREILIGFGVVGFIALVVLLTEN
jgi:hypothetical protein